MEVAIIGSGKVGSAVAGVAVKAGHSVTLAASHPEHAQEAAAKVGADFAADASSAARRAEVIVLAVPFAAAQQVAEEIREAASDKVVIDTTNALNQDYSGLLTEGGPSAGERIQSWLPGAKVVKALNSMFSSKQADPVAEGEPVDAFIAGDDDAAKARVMGLLQEMGFRPVDVGPLRQAKWLEAMAFLIISVQALKNGNWQSAWKLLDAPPAALKAPSPAGSQAQT